MKTKKVTTFLLLTLCCTFFSGCFTLPNWGLKQDRQEIAGEISRKESELDRHTSAYISGTVDALSLSENKSKEDLVALDLARKAQEIVGLPQPGDKIHIDDVINNNEIAVKNLSDREEDVITLARRKQMLGHDLKDTEEKLISLGELKAKEQKDGFFDSMWSWLTGTFGIVGAIAVLIIGGPALLPIITQFIAWLVSRIPGLISWLGITSSQMTSNIIRGVQDAKHTIKSSQDDRKFSKNEVLNIFGSSLGNSTNISDKNAIDRIKRKFK